MRWISILVLALAAGGCNTTALVDDVDLELDFTPLIGPSDNLHTPYVLGSTVTVYVQNSKNIDVSEWSIISSDPTIFATSNLSHFNDGHGRTQVSATGSSLAEGVADLIVLDGTQHEMHRQSVAVKLPDRIELRAHGLLLIDRPDAEADVSEARIQQGGTATYLVRYWKGNEMLSGNGALSTMSPASTLQGHVEQTFLFENRDWLQITSNATGSQQLGLLVGGVHVADFPVETVPPTDIVDVNVRGESETRTHKGNWLVALAEAVDGAGRGVYGVEYSWKLDSASQLGLGDIYRYSYDPKQPHVLTASFNGMSATAMIHGYGFVDSTNNLGCSYGGHPAKPAAALLLVGIAFLLLARRRLV